MAWLQERVASLWARITQLFESDGSFVCRLPAENAELLGQRMAAIRGRFAGVEPPGDAVPARLRAYRELETILEGPAAPRADGSPTPGTLADWNVVHLGEQLLAHLVPADQLAPELIDQLEQLRPIEPERHQILAAEWQRLAALDPCPEARLRGLLGVLLRRVQWETSQRYIARQIGVLYARRLVTCFLLAAAVALGLVIYEMNADYWPGPDRRFGGLPLAVAGGLLGASFSMLTQQREIAVLPNLEEIRTAAGSPMILLRLGVGVGAATTLYFFFNAGLVDGELFPDLEKIAFVKANLWPYAEPPGKPSPLVPNGDLAKLVVWSFAAGFSQRLVPSLLARIGKAGEAGRAPSDIR